MAEGTPRRHWREVPAELRAAVGDLLGSAVVEASSQVGGFSPGSADRVITADGRRAFVKTASRQLNAHSVEIHRREASMASGLPATAHAPKLLGFVDQGEWVAVVLEDVEGRQPAMPWTAADLEAVLDALVDVAGDPVPSDFAGPPLEEVVPEEFAGWRELLALEGLRVPLDPQLAAWATARLPHLAEMADAAVGDVVGDRLVHRDVRADNILLRSDGTVALVDWPWAARGAAWFDALSLLLNVRLYDRGADVQAVIDRHPVFAKMDPDAATRVLAGFGGFFLPASMQEPIPALPTLRRFQLDQAVATLEWLRERMEPA